MSSEIDTNERLKIERRKIMNEGTVKRASSKQKGFVPIDIGLFKALVAKKKSYGEFANDFGKSDSWVGQCIARETMKKSDVLAVKTVYNVDIEYVPPVEEVKEPVVEPVESLDMQALYNTIYTAIYDALDKVFNH